MGDEVVGDRVEDHGLASDTTRPIEATPNAKEFDHLDSNPACASQVARSWMSLERKYRPQKMAALLRIMKDMYQNPAPAFMSYDVVKEIDAAFDAFIKATSKLAAAIPHSPHYEVLPYVMERRMPEEYQDVAEHYIDQVATFIRAAPEAPVLKPRVRNSVSTKSERQISTNRGRKDHRQGVRFVVAAVCWYIVNVERNKLRIGFDDEGHCKSRAAFIVHATLTGLGLTSTQDRSAVDGELKRARSIEWAGINFWDLIPVYPPLFAEE